MVRRKMAAAALAVAGAGVGFAGEASAASALDVLNQQAAIAAAGNKAMIFQDNLFVYDPQGAGPTNLSNIEVVFEFESLDISQNVVPPLSGGLTSASSTSMGALGISLRGIATGTINPGGVITNVTVDLYAKDSFTGLIAGEYNLATDSFATISAGIMASHYKIATFKDLDADDFWQVLPGAFGTLNFALGLSLDSAVAGFPMLTELPIGGVFTPADGHVFGQGQQAGGGTNGLYFQFDGDFAVAATPVPTPAAAISGLSMLAVLGLGRFARRRNA